MIFVLFVLGIAACIAGLGIATVFGHHNVHIVNRWDKVGIIVVLVGMSMVIASLLLATKVPA